MFDDSVPADAKFPNQHGEGLPPPPTPENPGQVYPKSDPSPAPMTPHPPASPLGNPFLLRSVLDDLDGSLSRALDTVRNETPGGEGSLLDMLEGWREDLHLVRAGVAVRSASPSRSSSRRRREEVFEEEERVPDAVPDAVSAESGGMFVD
ncbi:hypothetical protein EW146_g7844 [Bondarzewia mesenterica]|uniref:Uncharacterized protein n=1 Tax=Bondarzewia mesenterica TaxID=1095465 RepID=A0A4S4L5X1_9AGAM|nr:hypothetical protein EW146_g10022 [Bondarzewia mesenterica]THH12037.1 hypothetical protein EW146_g7844 [Bondarzewia mesenterica]